MGLSHFASLVALAVFFKRLFATARMRSLVWQLAQVSQQDGIPRVARLSRFVQPFRPVERRVRAVSGGSLRWREARDRSRRLAGAFDSQRERTSKGF